MIQVDIYLFLQFLIVENFNRIEIVDFVRAALSPLNVKRNEFYSFFDSIKYDLTFNGQVIMLEHLLNDKFDNEERRIYIEDAIQIPELLLYNISENNELKYIYNKLESKPATYLYNKLEYDNEFDFTVFVPSDISDYLIEMNFLLNKYKLAGTRYQIKTI